MDCLTGAEVGRKGKQGGTRSIHRYENVSEGSENGPFYISYGCEM